MANTANTVGWLVYKITGDASLLYKELDKVTNELEETSDSFDALSKSVRSFATKVLTGVLVKALADTASRMEELESKFETVFGDLARESEAWAANYSEAVNRGQLATMEFMATIQDIQTGYGMAVDEAARFSQAVVGITNDLASFSNIRFDEAMAAMQSGLAQEFEALRRLGVGISVEIINQGEYASALGKTWDEMSNLERQQAILNEVVKQSPNALHQTISSWEEYNWQLGDAARTSGSYANTLAGFKGALQDLAAEMGDNLLPSITGVLGIGTELLQLLADLPDGIQAVATAAGVLAVALNTLGTTPVGIVVSALASLVVLVTGLPSDMDRLENQTDSLARATASYSEAVRGLAGDTSDLTAEQVALYEAQRDLARADALDSLKDLRKTWKDNVDELEALEYRLESLKGTMGAYDMASKLGGAGGALAMLSEFEGRSQAFLDSYVDTLTDGSIAQQEATARNVESWKDMVLQIGQTITEVEADQLKLSGMIDEAVAQMAIAYREGLLNGGDLQTLQEELASDIMDVVVQMKEYDESTRSISTTTSEAVNASREWRDALAELHLEMAEDAENWQEVHSLQAAALEKAYNAAFSSLADTFSHLFSDMDISSMSEDEMREVLEADQEAGEELAALDEYYALRRGQAYEDMVDAIAAEEERLKGIRDDFSRSLDEDIKALSDSMRQSESASLIEEGLITEGYNVLRAILEEERQEELADFEKRVAAGEAYAEDLEKLERKYELSFIQIDRNEADAWANLDKEREDYSQSLQDDLESLQDSMRSSTASELLDEGNVKESFEIRRKMLEEDQKEELESFDKRLAAGEAFEEDRAKIIERHHLEQRQLMAEETQAYIDSWNEAEEERKESEEDASNAAKEARENEIDDWKRFGEELVATVSSIYASIIDIQESATDKRIQQIEEQEKALLESLGLQEESEKERLQRELEEAQAKGDAETAHEKAQELERLRIQEETDEQIAKLEREQAQREKNYAIFEATISMLTAGIKALADPGGLVGFALATLATATGAAQIAAIAAQPLPSYDVGAVDISEDQIARVHQGEMIVPADFAEGIRNGDVTLGGGNVEVQIFNYTGAQVRTEETSDKDLRQIRIMIGETVSAQITEGRYDRAMAARYGTRRNGLNG